MVPEESDSHLVSVGAAATMLGVKIPTLYAWAAQGRIPCVRVGRCLRFSPAALKKWIAERTVEVRND